MAKKLMRQSRKSKRTIEDRYFVTNRMLKAEKALRLVRLHWGIESAPQSIERKDSCCDELTNFAQAA
jgi:hypothetical protein